jgi:hypothetical protein
LNGPPEARIVFVTVHAEADPLRVGDLRVVPNLDAPLSKATAANLSFFVMLSPGPGPAPRLTLASEAEATTILNLAP